MTMLQFYHFFFFSVICAARERYTWGIHNGTGDMTCEEDVEIYDPTSAIAKSCNYKKDCNMDSPEK